jgi:homoserine dehydrogenase
VLGDVIDAARELLSGSQVAPRIRVAPGDVVDFSEVSTKWYVRLEVADRPGVLARIAAAFGTANVSIKSVRQEGRGETATLLLVTHEAPEANQQAAVGALRRLSVVREVAAVVRVQSDEA